MKRKDNAKNSQIMSEEEKRILRIIIPEAEPLPYPTRTLAMSIGPDAEEFVIPDCKKAQVLQELYPFASPPDINETMFDLHENKPFRVGDFKVIREDNRNFLVSPYYAKSGGMVIDWITGEESESGKRTMLLRKPKEKDEQAPDAVIGNVQVIKTGSCEASTPEA